MCSRLPMPKSRVLLMVVSVRRARPSLWYCLILLNLVIDVQRRGHAFGQHARAKTARRSLGHAPLEDQLHLIGPAQVQVLADDFLEEDAARLRPIEHLGQRKLRLQDRHVVAVAGLAILRRCRDAATVPATCAATRRSWPRTKPSQSCLQAFGVGTGENAVVRAPRRRCLPWPVAA